MPINIYPTTKGFHFWVCGGVDTYVCVCIDTYGNRTGYLSVLRPSLNPLSHANQGPLQIFSLTFFKDLINVFILERGKRRVKEKHRPVASQTPPTGDLAHNPGMWPDWELNQRLFSLQANAQSTGPHQPGLKNFIKSLFEST